MKNLMTRCRNFWTRSHRVTQKLLKSAICVTDRHISPIADKLPMTRLAGDGGVGPPLSGSKPDVITAIRIPNKTETAPPGGLLRSA